MNQVVQDQTSSTSRSAVWHPRPGRKPWERPEKLRLVMRLQQEADHFADEFIRPGQQAERSQFPVLFRDPGPLDWLEPVALVAQRIDDAHGPGLRHAVGGLPVCPGVIAPWLA